MFGFQKVVLYANFTRSESSHFSGNRRFDLLLVTMDGLAQLTLPEAIAISQNPYAIIIRSKSECGIPGTGHVAALTNTFSQIKTLPHAPDIVRNAIGEEICSGEQISIVKEDDWPKMRSLLERQHLLDEFGLKIDTSYDEMLISGFQRLVNNAELFENVSFPTVFMFGTGGFCVKRPTPMLFPEYFKHISRLSTFNSASATNWLIWCELIEAAALVIEKKVRNGCFVDERRHYSFLQNCCALCGSLDETVKRCSRCHVMGYCGREHQIEDFERHKKLCKRYQRPGDPL